MFENILYQSAPSLLEKDITANELPGSILFAGPAASGKLSAALETARVLCCKSNGALWGKWNCTCSSCAQHKALVNANTLIAGPGDRTLEIRAAKATLLAENARNSNHLEAARYLYIRAVRKLTMRFSPILWEGDDKLAKFSPLLQTINENLETLNPGREIPDGDTLQKILDTIENSAEKLEDSFLYDSIPVSQIRNFSSWAHLKSGEGKKVLIIENADLMADSARNALLKILEEPPENVLFILTTTKRNAILPTILSRVRTYNFFERTAEQQKTVVSRVFHYDESFTHRPVPSNINSFLQSYLDIKPEAVTALAAAYFREIIEGHVPDMASIVSSCCGFQPRILFTIFLQGIIDSQKPLMQSAQGAELSVLIVEELRKISNNIGLYNQNPLAALEQMTRDFMLMDYENGGGLKQLISIQDGE